jgi:hypothetical protein
MGTVSPSQLAQIIADSQTRARSACAQLVKAFSFTPDNKVKWTPSPTSRTSLAIVAHCAMANGFFAKALRGEEIAPMPTHEEMKAMERREEAAVTDHAEAVRQLQASCEEVVSALSTMTPERYATSPNSPHGPFPMSFWMSLAGMHMEYHAAQINYLQTMWGDLVDHMM